MDNLPSRSAVTRGVRLILPFRLTCVAFCLCTSTQNIERTRIEQGLHFPKAAVECHKDIRVRNRMNYTIPRQVPVAYSCGPGVRSKVSKPRPINFVDLIKRDRCVTGDLAHPASAPERGQVARRKICNKLFVETSVPVRASEV